MAFCESWQFRAKKLCYTAIIESIGKSRCSFYAAVAQLAEQPSCNRQVGRSIRPGGSMSRTP